jgi:hypothetical protein
MVVLPRADIRNGRNADRAEWVRKFGDRSAETWKPWLERGVAAPPPGGGAAAILEWRKGPIKIYFIDNANITSANRAVF